MPMAFWTENIIMYGLIAVCFFLTIVGMGGNFWMLLLGSGYAIITDFERIQPRILFFLALLFVLGELWEFGMSFLGIKRSNVSWLAVFCIGCGTIAGAIMGTFLLPILGSLAGGAVGAAGVAYLYEYRKSSNKADAKHLAWLAFKAQFLAAVGKLVAGLAMGILLCSQLTW